MNALTYEMKRSLRELDLGLKGELTITSDMEDLSNSLFFDQVSPMIFSNFCIYVSILSGSPKLGKVGLCLPQWLVGLVRSLLYKINRLESFLL